MFYSNFFFRISTQQQQQQLKTFIYTVKFYCIYPYHIHVKQTLSDLLKQAHDDHSCKIKKKQIMDDDDERKKKFLRAIDMMMICIK